MQTIFIGFVVVLVLLFALRIIFRYKADQKVIDMEKSVEDQALKLISSNKNALDVVKDPFNTTSQEKPKVNLKIVN